MKYEVIVEKAMQAMKEAAEVARKRAIMHGSHLVRWKDNRVVLIDPRTGEEVDRSLVEEGEKLEPRSKK